MGQVEASICIYQSFHSTNPELDTLVRRVSHSPWDHCNSTFTQGFLRTHSWFLFGSFEEAVCEHISPALGQFGSEFRREPFVTSESSYIKYNPHETNIVTGRGESGGYNLLKATVGTVTGGVKTSLSKVNTSNARVITQKRTDCNVFGVPPKRFPSIPHS